MGFWAAHLALELSMPYYIETFKDPILNHSIRIVDKVDYYRDEAESVNFNEFEKDDPFTTKKDENEKKIIKMCDYGLYIKRRMEVPKDCLIKKNILVKSI